MKNWLLWLFPRMSVFLLTLGISLYGAEWGVKNYVLMPDSLGFTLMNQRWMESYWKPINDLGYRDWNWSEADLAAKTHILVTGDSFPSGHGIEHSADRFPDQLGFLLGAEYQVTLAAKPGWSPYQILDGLYTYPYTPDALILSYYINDILTACRFAAGVDPLDERLQPSGLTAKVVNNSYLANYVYWNFYKRPRLVAQFQVWTDAMHACYFDENAWAYHEAELLNIYHWSQIHQVPMTVVLFPDLGNLDKFADGLAKVQAFFEERQIPTLNLSEKWAAYSYAERVASPLDTHPSELLHQETAQALAQMNLIRPLPPFQPSPENLLTPAAWEVYQNHPFELLPAGESLFNPASNWDEMLLLASAQANVILFDQTTTHQHAYDLLAARDHFLKEGDLSAEQEAAITQWRSTKAASDLQAAGINYLFLIKTWVSWLSPEESAALFESGDYELFAEWRFDEAEDYYQIWKVAK